MKSQRKPDKLIPQIEGAFLSRRALWVLLAGVFLISFSLLAFEITLTRVLSVVLSYHYVFVVVSLALLGLGVGGIFVYFFRRKGSLEPDRFSSLGLFPSLFSLSIPITIILITLIAYLGNLPANILFYGFLFFIPFFFAGVFLAEVLRTFPTLSSRIYGMDLIGAATGAFGGVLILNGLGGINGSFLLALVAAIATLLMVTLMPGKNFKAVSFSVVSLIVAFSLLGTNFLGSFLNEVPVDSNPTKEIYQPLRSASQGKIIETRWSAFGRTDLVAFANDPEWMAFFVDGTSGAAMYRFSGDLDNLEPKIESLKTEFPGYFPFQFLQEEQKDNALIIGPGGGKDILLTLMGGIGDITAIEVNRDLVEMVRNYAGYNGGIYSDRDEVTIIVDEGRNFLKRQKGNYDIIMLSLPVTRTSRSLEGYSLTENFIFTTESFNDYLEHLSDEGSLIIVSHAPLEVLRLLSLSLASLKERGVSEEEAMKRIYLVSWEKYPTLVIQKTPFTSAELETIREAIQQSAFNSPEIQALNEGQIKFADVEKALRQRGQDISPVTDNSPFFYKFELGIPGPVSLVLWSSVVLLLLVIIVPLISGRKRPSSRKSRQRERTGFDRYSLRFVVLFLMLGVGFMLVEISLIQKLILFLGQPVLSLAVLLFSLLVGVGIGSLSSGRLLAEKLTRGTAIVCLALVAMLLIYIFILPLIFNQLLGLELAIRLLVTVVLLTPLGFLMGFPFPSGLRLLREIRKEDHIPWMWGINGVSSVLGSALAMLIAISLGLTQALWIATGCYLIVFLIFYTTQYKSVLAERR